MSSETSETQDIKGIEVFYSNDIKNSNPSNGSHVEKSSNRIFSFTKSKKIINFKFIEDADINPYIKEISGFNRDKRFDKICITKDESGFMVFGRLYSKSISKCQIYEKLRLDIGLNHHCIPPLFGICTNKDGSEIIEIRKIGFEPFPLTRELLADAPRSRVMKIISQIVDFVNYMSEHRHSVSLLTLDDIFSCCFLDEEFNVYFGDTSFIEVDYYFHKSQFSLGMIVMQLLGCEISVNRTVECPVLDESIPLYWRRFISMSLIGNVDVSTFYSPFMQHRDSDIMISSIKDDKEDNVLDVDDYQIDDMPVIEYRFIESHNFDRESAKEIIRKYQSLKYTPVTIKEDKRFGSIKAEVKEDGSTVFIDSFDFDHCGEPVIDDYYITIVIDQFLIRIDIKHPIVLPIKGFSFDPDLFMFYFYRETNQNTRPIDYEYMRRASDEQKIKWMKQIADFVLYLTENNQYIINFDDLKPYAVLGQNDDIIFVKIDILEPPDEDDYDIFFNIGDFYSFTKDFLIEESLFPEMFPTSLKVKYLNNCLKFKDFIAIKNILDTYEPNINNRMKEITDYLMDYFVEKEIDGNQCHVTIYKRKLLSNKKFKRLVLKKYDFAFSNELKITLQSTL